MPFAVFLKNLIFYKVELYNNYMTLFK